MNQLPRAILTLDVEDWEHANYSQLKGRGSQLASERSQRAYAMDANTDLWIHLLAQSGARSTCFVLGEFARRYPQAIRRLHQAGHEIASHCDTHELVREMSRERFREAIQRSFTELGFLTGERPIGFRAPSWSADDRLTPWFCEELQAQGAKYDSSEFPVRTPLFGTPQGPLGPYWKGAILRLPVTVLALGPFRAPFSSGAFFRLTPLSVLRLGLSRALNARRPPMVVLHPRELDPWHPRLPIYGWEAWVHYVNLDTTVPKLLALSRTFKFLSVCRYFGSKLDTPGAALDNE